MTVENILTVDLEDWFHICGVEKFIPETSWPELESRVAANTVKILDVLSQKKVSATFFVLGFIAEKHPDLISKIEKAGHEIATHGYAHRQVYTMTPDMFRQDLIKAVRIITQITGQPVKGYRAPEWSIRDDSLWALDILQKEGFEYDSSMTPLPIIGNQNYSKIPYRLTLDEGQLWEFPPMVGSTPFVNFPLGGGWGLRVFPYNLIRFTIQKLNRQGQPAVIFFHPREFDRNNPSIRLPLAKKFVLNARVERTEKRLERLLDDFSFTSVSNVLKQKNLH
ncbi:MAG: polysaccharide deacetylase family protein [Deltaproteobacteria bacterium]|nr:polysaccharide deacetylase family protein [Deltaproteobacteria bacterium]MBW2660725.1 polysaccharide deacetylase family protein [Deltaproteobacteria bacterium]